MKLSLGPVAALAIAGLVVGAAACAGSEDDPFAPAPVDSPDATFTDPEEDDSGGADASADAGPKVCSDHGFCHTPVPGGRTLEAVWGDGAGVVWAVSSEGDVLRWDGNAWNIHASGLGPLHAVWGTSPTDVWIGGEGGLRHGTGATPASIAFEPAAGETARVAAIWGVTADDVWAVGAAENDEGETEGRVLHYTGTSGWQLEPALPHDVFAYVHAWGSAESGVWIAGMRPMPDDPFFTEVAIFRRAVGSSDFDEVTLPGDPEQDPIFARMGSLGGAAVTSATTMWIVGRTVIGQPGIWRGTSADDGKTFSFTYANDGRDQDPRLNAVFGSAADEAWTAGDYGQVRRWDGTKWSPQSITVTKLPIIDSLHAVWSGGSPKEVWIVGKGRALRRSASDGGAQ